jgi:hypothetical protein
MVTIYDTIEGAKEHVAFHGNKEGWYILDLTVKSI